MTLAGLSPAGVLLLRAGEPLALRFVLQDADGDPQDLIGRSFALVVRRSSAIAPIVTIDGELGGEGRYVMVAITAEQATALYEAGQGKALSYDFVELSGGASISRWTARVNVAEGPDLPSDIVPVWVDLPYSQATLNPQTLVAQERGARGRDPMEVLADAGLIDEPSIEAMLQLIKQNQTWATTADLEAANVSGGSAVLTESGKAGLFTIRDYADFVDAVAADTGKINYIRSTSNVARVWVRSTIVAEAAASVGSAGGGTVQQDLDANKSAIILRTGGTLTSREALVRIDDDDSRDTVLNWLETCYKRDHVAILSKEDFEDAPGAYTANPIHLSLPMGRKLNIKGRPGTSIKGLPDGDTPSDIAVLRFDGPSGADPLDPNIPNVNLFALHLDASQRTFVVEAPTSTALTLRDLGHVTIDLCDFYGGPDYEAGMTAGIGGDTGVSFTRVRNLDISRSPFRGFLDKGWYGSLSGRIRAWANWYFDCNTAGAFTRDGTSATLWGEKVLECGLGFGVTEGLVNGVWAPPARDLTATQCEFDRMGGRMFRIIMASAKIRACEGRNWGYKPRAARDGTYIATASQAAVRLDGAYDCDIELDLSMPDWPDTANHVGFDMRDKVLNSITYRCEDNDIHAHITGLPNGRALVEINGTDRTNSVIDCDNVATARNGGTGDLPVRTSTSAPNMSTHTVRPKGGKEYILRNNVPFSSFFTLIPTAIGSPSMQFTAPTINECHAQRNGDEVTLHVRVFAPFVMGADAQFTGTIAGNVLTVTAMTSGAIAIGHAVRWDGMAASPVITALGTGTGGVGTYLLDLEQTVPPGTAMKSIMDGDIRLTAQTFDAAAGVATIVDKTMTVSSVTSGTFAVGQTVVAEGILSKTVILESLGGGEYRVSRSQSFSGALKAVTSTMSRGIGGISNTTLTVSTMAVGALAVGMGIEGPAYLPGTLLMEDLGGGLWRVNKAQSVAAGSAFSTVRTGLPWIAASAGGGDAEGVTGIDSGIIFPPNSRTLVGQVPAGRDFLRCWWQTLNRALRVRDLMPAGASLRANITIIYRCED